MENKKVPEYLLQLQARYTFLLVGRDQRHELRDLHLHRFAFTITTFMIDFQFISTRQRTTVTGSECNFTLQCSFQRIHVVDVNASEF